MKEAHGGAGGKELTYTRVKVPPKLHSNEPRLSQGE